MKNAGIGDRGISVTKPDASNMTWEAGVSRPKPTYAGLIK
jgi:hypothetical protein